MATKDPEFAVGEPVRTLSDSLGLPEWLEPNRHAIEESLTPMILKAIESQSTLPLPVLPVKT